MEEEKDQLKTNEQPNTIKVKSSRRRRIGANAPKIFRILIFGGLTIIILLLIMISGLFDLEEVEVTDVKGKDPEFANYMNLQAIVEDEYLGKNYFFSDPNEIKEGLIKGDPYVNDLWIEKIAPRSLHVFVVEKIPYMYIQFEDKCILVDEGNGYITEYSTILPEKDPESENEPQEGESDAYNCKENAEYNSAHYVDFKEDHYEFIIKDNTFFIFDQIVQTVNLLDHYGVESKDIAVGDRLLIINTNDGKVILIDPFDNFDTQLKRLVLILNQIRWGDQDFVELDLRFKRPVMRNEKTY